ncbi:hypothetical protein [Halorubrum ezzemoulense]|uniref:hypothetical protein n=1 Tax=Halorubrum ezzemoulense TaxID=337243 RepID=UPI00232E3F92|nr:hypothetical protein [Halorubrum ezzemoulense]MDB9252893.1 hypothetical protein [Halorubrum ezzemoulense]MDB9256723.1 hypothetical protein [Halorubrum ezzemoulense]MDB9277031.1 hypothetical protein [Halorubrum ezzemoulense]
MTEEPLVDSAAIDDPVNPTELVVAFSSGLDTAGRMEITWWKRGAYRYHYTEPDGIDFRFDNHPKANTPDAHFHPPPDAGTAEPSFLGEETQVQVVTRAVISRWREVAVEEEPLDILNADAGR